MIFVKPRAASRIRRNAAGRATPNHGRPLCQKLKKLYLEVDFRIRLLFPLAAISSLFTIVSLSLRFLLLCF